MDPRTNPYAPGAGVQPPELAGRDEVIDRAAVALERIKDRRPARSVVLHGLRGVGKTVLLNKICQEAEVIGCATVAIEAPENRSLPGLLAPALRRTLLTINRGQAIWSTLARARRALASFVGTVKIKYQDVEVTIDSETAPGIADSGDLESDLIDLLTALGQAAADRNGAVVFAVDDLQYVPEEQIASLILALHRLSQHQLPVTMVAAGLPQLVGRMGKAKSYAERLFEFTEIDRLQDEDARLALCVPAEKDGVEFTDAAVNEVLGQTQGYPYFLQEWGKHCWDIAETSPISLTDATAATAAALAQLDAGFFRVRFDRLTPAEKRYMRAMAELGPGPHRSGDIADLLGKKVTSAAPVRYNLINKGMQFLLRN